MNNDTGTLIACRMNLWWDVNKLYKGIHVWFFFSLFRRTFLFVDEYIVLFLKSKLFIFYILAHLSIFKLIRA